MDALIFDQVEVRTGGRTILGPVSLRIGSGETWILLGPNGCGKTTLLSVAGAWRHPSRGRVTILGQTMGTTDVRSLRRRIAHVSHHVSDRLRPEQLAIDCVMAGARSTLETWAQRFEPAETDEARALLVRVGCAAVADHPLGSCSQGERQRVLLARAMMSSPELLLLDEPASGLDLPGREALLSAVRAIGDGRPLTTLVATHHFEEIPATSTHALLMRDGAPVISGPIQQTLTSEAASDCFGVPIEVSVGSGRWSAVARTST
jgi:iron complex transport system ATP-binding protein